MYQALYRKYRPQTFEDVVGQRSVTQTLKAQLVSGKLSHAYLFTGTRGTGKTTCAKILAKAVNCLDPQDGNPCNACAACRAIDAGSCVDVLEIDAASNNGVDHIRALRDDAVYTPTQVRKRVYIVDEVHMLSVSAFNALLKIIEEPPEHLLFILATTELHKVPATILSRCQRFSFRRLQASDIAARINYVAYQEGIELQPEAAELLASLADGALRDGLSLLDQCASAGAVTEETVCETLGLAGTKNTAQVLDAVADGDSARALELFTGIYEAGKDLSAFVGELSTLARDLLILKTAPKSGAEMLSGVSTPAERTALMKKLSAPQLLRMLNLLQQTANSFASGTNRRLETELCLIEMSSPALETDAQALSARIGKLEEAIASGVQIRTEVKQENAKERQAAPQTEAPEDRQEEPEEKPEAPAEKTPERKAAPKRTGGLPENFWAELCRRAAPEIAAPVRGMINPQTDVRPTRKGDVITLETNVDFLERIINAEVLQTLSEKASYLLGEKVRVQIGRRGKNDEADPMQELLHFGREHDDVVHIDS